MANQDEKVMAPAPCSPKWLHGDRNRNLTGFLEETVVSSSMASNFSGFSRRGPDSVTEELVTALSNSKSYEFKALFTIIHEALRSRNAASGGEEMLRLRAYDKLQNLVLHGQVKKAGKKYKGVAKALLLLGADLKALRENGPSFSRKVPLASQ
jgi:hypothetical protein